MLLVIILVIVFLCLAEFRYSDAAQLRREQKRKEKEAINKK